MNQDIWTPPGMDLVAVDALGEIKESQTQAVGYKAGYRCPKCLEVRPVYVAASEEDSVANVEDILGSAMERDYESHVVEEHQYIGSRQTPREAMKDERVKREMAGALREWREAAKKRSESSNSKLYY